MADAIANLLSGAANGYTSADLAKMTDAQRLAWYRKMNQTPPAERPSPLAKAVKWIGDKLGAPAVPAVPAGNPGNPGNPGNGVSLVERLKAGNIDQVGSEAYNRWGQGKVDGDAAELARESRRATQFESAPVEPPVAEASDLDANRHFTTQEWMDAPEYRQSNPMWDGLPNDDFAMNQGA